MTIEIVVNGDYFGYEKTIDGPNKRVTIDLLERDRVERILEDNDYLKRRNMELEEAIDEAKTAVLSMLRTIGDL